MGVAVLDGPELVYYAVKSFKKKRPADALLRATRHVLLRLIREHGADVLAYEKTFYVQSKNSALLQVQEAEIKRVARLAGLKMFGFAPSTVRQLLCEDGRATKQIVADLLADRYPELAPYRARDGRQRERYWLNMFDAVAVGIVCHERLTRDGGRAT